MNSPRDCSAPWSMKRNKGAKILVLTATMLSSLSSSSDLEFGTGAHSRRTMLSPYERSSSIVLPCALKSGNSTAPSWLQRSPKRGSGAPIGFINPGYPRNPLPCDTRPSRQHSGSTHLGQPRYVTIGQDHDPTTNRNPRPEGLVGTPTRKVGREYGPTPTEFPD